LHSGAAAPACRAHGPLAGRPLTAPVLVCGDGGDIPG